MSRRPRVGLALRLAPLLLVPVLLAASTFPGEFRVSLEYWVLSCCAAVIFAFGGRWPVATSLVLSVLAVPMFAAEAWGLSELVPYLGALAVADVAARSDRDRDIALVAVGWLIALVLGVTLDQHAELWSAASAVTILAGIGLPVLFGLYLRGQARLAGTYRQLAEDAELRRAAAESAVRLQERSAMARELHDLVAHHMASIVLRVGVAEHVLDGADPRVAAVLDDVHRTAADALSDIRRLQAALRDPVLSEVATIEPDALWKEIDAAVERTRAANFTVEDHIDRDIVGLDTVARLTLLRVTQEALTNVMKHADASGPVQLTIDRRDGGVGVLVVSFGGRGSSPKTGGNGIIGMTERLSLIGGRLDVRPTERGWEVEAWLPQSAC
ncbi:histidine kinase [Mycolicibacterium wolinskyi]|uniref:histidine kinase n=1 Tax=Mycolicibacterium wolinskyi TaxID=59750 RepID=A0A132PQF2_9MYCO|nr:histidine kinase [Mycolicibacterium wolinskyi]